MCLDFTFGTKISPLHRYRSKSCSNILVLYVQRVRTQVQQLTRSCHKNLRPGKRVHISVVKRGRLATFHCENWKYFQDILIKRITKCKKKMV